MMDNQKVEQAIREASQDPAWREKFMNAPAGAMERLAISFYFSTFYKDFSPTDFDEYRQLREEIEKTLDEEDLQYLIDNVGKDSAVKHYTSLLEKIKRNTDGE